MAGPAQHGRHNGVIPDRPMDHHDAHGHHHDHREEDIQLYSDCHDLAHNHDIHDYALVNRICPDGCYKTPRQNHGHESMSHQYSRFGLLQRYCLHDGLYQNVFHALHHPHVHHHVHDLHGQLHHYDVLPSNLA